MSNYISVEKYIDRNMTEVDSDLTERYKKGIAKNLTEYIKKTRPEAVKIKKEKLLIDEDLLDKEFRKEYLRKTDIDFSAMQFAESTLRHPGIPPLDKMSIDSLYKKILELFDWQYRDEVYIKKTSGEKNVKCLGREYEMKIPLEPEVAEIILLQKKKADARNQGSTEESWLEYMDEKGAIELSLDFSEEYHEQGPSWNDEPSLSAVDVLLSDDFIDRLADRVAKKVLELIK